MADIEQKARELLTALMPHIAWQPRDAAVVDVVRYLTTVAAEARAEGRAEGLREALDIAQGWVSAEDVRACIEAALAKAGEKGGA